MQIVLVHSPLVSSMTWRGVGDALSSQGFSVSIPRLQDDGVGATPYWRQHALSILRAMVPTPTAERFVLVGHSGAGPLLPEIGARLGRRVAGYVFVDAGLPQDGLTRLELMAREDPEAAGRLRAHLESGARFPDWTEQDVLDALPDKSLRARFLAALAPRELAFFTEPIGVAAGWPNAPAAYVKLTEAYRVPYEDARSRGWATRAFDASHFHMLLYPEQSAGVVADAIGSILPIASVRGRAEGAGALGAAMRRMRGWLGRN